MQALVRRRAELEQKFEALEVQVRDATEKLRREKDALEAELNPMLNQFNHTKSSIEFKKQEALQIE